jgi:hypothetical protein
VSDVNDAAAALVLQIVSLLDYSQGFGHTDLLQATENDFAEFVEARRHHRASVQAA